jgi:membrane associated rhomboid family serine protease
LIPFSDADVQRRSRPFMNFVLLGLNSVIFFYELQIGGLGFLRGDGNIETTTFFFKWGLIPDELTRGESFSNLALTQFTSININSPIPTWVTIFTSMFIHAGLLHFASNMMFLWVFGYGIERRLGHLKFFLFYLLTGAIAALTHLAIDIHSQTPLVGASGAISGVLGAYLLLYPYNRIKVLIVFYFITAVQLRAMYVLGLWFLLQLFNALDSLGISNQVDVAFFAHIGGFIAGAAIIICSKLLTGQALWPSRRRPPWDYWYQTGR